MPILRIERARWMQFWKIVLQDSNEVKMTKLQKLRKDNGISLSLLAE